MSGLLPLEFVLTPPLGAAVAYFGMFFFFAVTINRCHKKHLNESSQILTNLTNSHCVFLEADLFAGARLHLVIFHLFLLFLISESVRRDIFPPLAQCSLEHGRNISISKRRRSVSSCVCACMYTRTCTCANVFVCVCARRRLSLNVWQAAELRDEDSSLKSSANIRWHLCLPLTQKQNSYLLSTLQRHTNETGRRKCTFWFCPREKVSEVNQAQREKQKQKRPQSMSVPYKTCLLPARCAQQMFLSAMIKPSASIRSLKLIEHKSLKSLERTTMFVNLSPCMCVPHKSK